MTGLNYYYLLLVVDVYWDEQSDMIYKMSMSLPIATL